MLVDPPAQHPSSTSKRTKILLTTDLNPRILNTIPLDRVSFICTYHPTLFRPTSKLLGTSDPLIHSLMLCIQHGIPVYSPHTALDAANFGINDWIATSLLAFDDKTNTPLQMSTSTSQEGHEDPSSSSSSSSWQHFSKQMSQYIHPIMPKFKPSSDNNILQGHENASAGKFITIPKPISSDFLIQRVKHTFNLKTGMLLLLLLLPFWCQFIIIHFLYCLSFFLINSVMFAKGYGSNDTISTLAICPGSG